MGPRQAAACPFEREWHEPIANRGHGLAPSHRYRKASPRLTQIFSKTAVRKPSSASRRRKCRCVMDLVSSRFGKNSTPRISRQIAVAPSASCPLLIRPNPVHPRNRYMRAPVGTHDVLAPGNFMPGGLCEMTGTRRNCGCSRALHTADRTRR